MILIDWVILGLVALSGLISIKRGFVKEALSLVTWVIAFFIARMFSGSLAHLLGDLVTTPSARWGIAYGILFAGTLIVGALVNHLVAEFVKVTGLTSTDRVFGMVFGITRGLVILTAIIFGIQFTAIPEDPWWKESIIIPYFEVLVDWARNTVPDAANKILSLGS
jgi:membrane protein required for colicin V production